MGLKMAKSKTEQQIKHEPHLRCNFCTKDAAVVFMLITGPSVNICNECVVQSMQLVMSEITRRENKLNKVVAFTKE
jgi:ATP-dependent protease Clp ATPase subunit